MKKQINWKRWLQSYKEIEKHKEIGPFMNPKKEKKIRSIGKEKGGN